MHETHKEGGRCYEVDAREIRIYTDHENPHDSELVDIVDREDFSAMRRAVDVYEYAQWRRQQALITKAAADKKAGAA